MRTFRSIPDGWRCGRTASRIFVVDHDTDEVHAYNVSGESLTHVSVVADVDREEAPDYDLDPAPIGIQLADRGDFHWAAAFGEIVDIDSGYPGCTGRLVLVLLAADAGRQCDHRRRRQLPSMDVIIDSGSLSKNTDGRSLK